MNREALLCGVVALGCHALLLFGPQWGSGARPRPVADTEVEVSLVEAAPPAPAAPVAEIAPPPAAEPLVEPPAETPPEPAPEPAPKPRPAAPRAPQPAAPAPRSGTVGGTGRPAVSAGAGLGHTPPRYRSNPRPDYPAAARRLRQQGRVLIEVAVSAAGQPTSVSVKQSSGVAALDAAALAAVRRWTFEPARTAGRAVAARVEIPVRFDLAR